MYLQKYDNNINSEIGNESIIPTIDGWEIEWFQIIVNVNKVVI